MTRFVDPNRWITERFRSTLCRAPNVRELSMYVQAAREGMKSRELGRLLKKSPEHRELIIPLRREIDRAFTQYCMRKPTEDERAYHIDYARNELESFQGVRLALSSGTIRNHLGIRPINLEMDITNQCQLRCVMCTFSHPSHYKRKRKDMPLDLFERLAAGLFPGVNGLSLSFGTEPLLHEDLPKMVSIASKYNVSRIYMNTNGMLLNEKSVEALIRSGLHGISISMDAASRECYERIRVGGNFEKLLENIRTIRRLKKRMGSDHPDVSLLFVMMRSNLRELPAFIDLAGDLGAAAVNAMHLIPFKMLENEDQSAAADKALCNEMLVEADRRARASGLCFVAPRPFSEDGKKEVEPPEQAHRRFGLHVLGNEAEDRPCPFPWHFMGIDCFGNVLPCGWWYGQAAMGNINKDDLLEIWQGRSYRTLRAELASHRLRGSCRTCPAAGMGDPDSASAFICR